MSVVFAVLLFSFLIFIHELGHFLAAKSFGVQVNEFSMFMGPVIWKKQKGETQYTIRCIPIGGYCAMEGEDGDSDNPRAFSAAAWWKRLIILVAGATMNFVAGVILLGCFFIPDQQFILPVVTQIEEGCAISGPEGIQEGDRIVKLDGETIYVYSDFSLLLSLNPGDVHDLVLDRSGERIVLDDFRMEKREFADPDGTTSLRYGFSFAVTDATFLQTIKYTWATTLDTVRLVRLSLKMLLSGQAGIQDVSGPVGIVQQMSEVADASGSFFYAFLNLLYFGGFIAINLAVMNLLPIPALDGGRIAGVLLTTLIEALIRKKIDPKYEGYVHAAGMIVLLLLMGAVMSKDIFQIIKG